MADTVDVVTQYNSPRRLVVVMTSESDGTGESAVAKVDKSAFTGPDGTEPSRFMIEEIEYDVGGMRVLLEWDHTTPDEIAVLNGAGFLDFTKGGKFAGKVDPASAGGTGDILLTTVGHTAGDGYTITLVMKKKD